MACSSSLCAGTRRLQECVQPRPTLLTACKFQIFLILFLLIVVIIIALLLIFGAYRGIRRLLGHGDYYMSDDSKFFLVRLVETCLTS